MYRKFAYKIYITLQAPVFFILLYTYTEDILNGVLGIKAIQKNIRK